MLLCDGEDYIELRPTERNPADSPCAGDVRFAVRVRFSSFFAESDAWVDASALRTFAGQLRDLEGNRHGVAAFESMSPGELRLEIRSVGSGGHVAAFGQVGNWCSGPLEGRYWSVVAFGIPFCPSLLPGIVQEFEALAADVQPR